MEATSKSSKKIVMLHTKIVEVDDYFVRGGKKFSSDFDVAPIVKFVVYQQLSSLKELHDFGFTLYNMF